MNWKTDWAATDNYAASGCADLDRLLANYAQLQALLLSAGYVVTLDAVYTNGFWTYPFADLLNAVEQNLNALNRLAIDWIEKDVVWQPALPGPTCEDVNRWEQNGKSLEGAITRLLSAFRYSGMEYSGG